MPDQVLNYKCPACGAPLKYDGKAGKLLCMSCGNTFELEAMQQAEEVASATAEQSIQWDTERDDEWTAEETQHLRTYSCPSCGAEIVVDESTVATECVYCGNSSIMPGGLSGSFRPDAVLPFIKTKEDAIAAYRQQTAGKKLLPRAFASKKQLNKITGVYVPFWLFQCHANANLSFRATRTRVHSTHNERITETDHFMVLRGGTLDFDGVPVKGSVKFDDTLMEAIEPFDYSQMKEFNAAYLTGYQAERYDIDAAEAEPRANERIRTSTVEAFTGTAAGYSSIVPQSANVQLEHGKVMNVMAPVWMLNTKWEGKTYTFAMNGQTGTIVGDFPEDKSAAWKWRLGLFFGVFAGTAVVSLLLSYLGVI